MISQNFCEFTTSQKTTYIDLMLVIAIQDYPDDPKEGSKCMVFFKEGTKIILDCSANFVMDAYIKSMPSGRVEIKG